MKNLVITSAKMSSMENVPFIPSKPDLNAQPKNSILRKNLIKSKTKSEREEIKFLPRSYKSSSYRKDLEEHFDSFCFDDHNIDCTDNCQKIDTFDPKMITPSTSAKNQKGM